MEQGRVPGTRTQEEQWMVEGKVFDIYAGFHSLPPNSQSAILEIRRENHVQYLTRGLLQLGPSFCVLDANRPWICYWILHSIAVLGESVDPNIEANTIDFLCRCQMSDISESSGKTYGVSRTVWTEGDMKLFVDILLEYKRKGEMKQNNFGKSWVKITKDFNAKSEYRQTLEQLSQKFHRFRIDWNAFKDLREKHTGLGWDHEKGTITASEERWKELIKVIDQTYPETNKNYKKFQQQGLEYNDEFTELFQSVGSVGAYAMATGQSQVSKAQEAGANVSETIRDEDGDKSSGKRQMDSNMNKEGDSRGKKMSKGNSKEDVFWEAATEAALAKGKRYNAQAAQVLAFEEHSIEKCIELLYDLEKDIDDVDLFLKASDAFTDEARRRIFLKFSREHRLAWIRRL